MKQFYICSLHNILPRSVFVFSKNENEKRKRQNKKKRNNMGKCVRKRKTERTLNTTASINGPRDEEKKKKPIHSVLFVLLLFHLLYLFKIQGCCRLAGIEFFMLWLHQVEIAFVPFPYPFFRLSSISISCMCERVSYMCLCLLCVLNFKMRS